MCTLNSSVIEYSENISIIWENLKLSFRICLGVIKSHYQTRRCVQIWNRTHWKMHGSHKRCVWNHVMGGDEMLATCLCPLILASDNARPPWHWLLMSSLPFQGCPLPLGAHKQQLQTQSFSLGSNLQNRMFLHLKKTSKENRVISRKCLFRENMTLSML